MCFTSKRSAETAADPYSTPHCQNISVTIGVLLREKQIEERRLWRTEGREDKRTKVKEQLREANVCVRGK